MNKVTRNEAIFEFIASKKGSYADAARTFGVSRQRVHQLLKSLVEPTKPSRRGVAGTTPAPFIRRNTVYGAGLRGQKLFERECNTRKIKFTRAWETENYDYIVNNQKVEVKFSSGAAVQGKNKGLKKYNATFVKNSNFDILAVFLLGFGWVFFSRDFLIDYKGGIGFVAGSGEILSEKIKSNAMTWDSLLA